MKVIRTKRNLMLLWKKIKGRRLLLPDVSNYPYDCMLSQLGRPQSE